MYQALTISQIIISVLLLLFILMQDKGMGLSATFGGSGNFYASKRGVEKILAKGTTILAILFFINAMAFLFV